jgi:hypothetical protein
MRGFSFSHAPDTSPFKTVSDHTELQDFRNLQPVLVCLLGVGIPMPKIMICCPILKQPVSTGLKTEAIKLDSLDGLSIPLRCPACLKMHHWEREDAWVEKDEA